MTMLYDVIWMIENNPNGYLATKIDAAALWAFTEGAVFDVVFDAAWALKGLGLGAIATAINSQSNQDYFAADLYHSGSSGEWLIGDTNLVQSRVLACDSRPDWEKTVVNWLMAGWVDANREFKDWAWRHMAYPVLSSCSSMTDVECDLGTWCYVFNLLASDGAWTNRASSNRPYGFWNLNNGWVSVFAGAAQGLNNDERLYLQRSIGSCTLQKLTVTYEAQGTLKTGRSMLGTIRRNGSSLFNTAAHVYALGSNSIEWTMADTLADEVWLTVTGATTSNDSEVRITSVKLEGKGVSPFGESNC